MNNFEIEKLRGVCMKFFCFFLVCWERVVRGGECKEREEKEEEIGGRKREREGASFCFRGIWCWEKLIGRK